MNEINIPASIFQLAEQQARSAYDGRIRLPHNGASVGAGAAGVRTMDYGADKTAVYEALLQALRQGALHEQLGVLSADEMMQALGQGNQRQPILQVRQ